MKGKRLRLLPKTLNQICPFYCLTETNGDIVDVGSSLKKLLGINSENIDSQSLGLFYELNMGEEDQTWRLDNIDNLQYRPFKLKCKRTQVILACEAIELVEKKFFRSKKRYWIIMMRPLIETSQELEKSGLNLQDFSLTDPIRTGLLNMLMEESLRENLLREIQFND